MRFGLFNQGDREPIEEYEGDFCELRSPYVEIFKEGDTPKRIAQIHLGPGQGVRVIKSTPVPGGDRRVPRAWQ